MTTMQPEPSGANLEPILAHEFDDGTESARFTNAARALAFGATMHGPLEAIEGIEEDVAELGITEWPRFELAGRLSEVHAESTQLLSDFMGEEVESLELEGAWHPDDVHGITEELWDVWRDADEEGRHDVYSLDAIPMAWLRVLQQSEDPLLSVAAGVALLPNSELLEQPLVGLEVARSNVMGSLPESHAADGQIDDPHVAIADAFLRPDRDESPPPPPPAPPSSPPRTRVSTLVHGTFGWRGDWWYPGGDFHDYVRQIRGNLYDGGTPFSWSGWYSRRSRETASARLARWAAEVSPSGLDTVFGHSYGGCVTLDATRHGLEIDTAVLLSSPVDVASVDWGRVHRCVSLRIHADLVLLAARRRQSFESPVEEHYLDRWFWAHSDSHEETVWEEEDCAAMLEL